MNDKIGLISVIVPVYKVEKYLSRCIESILAQTYKNIEIIIVDSGSSDSTLEISKNHNCIIKHINKDDFSFGLNKNFPLKLLCFL